MKEHTRIWRAAIPHNICYAQRGLVLGVAAHSRALCVMVTHSGQRAGGLGSSAYRGLGSYALRLAGLRRLAHSHATPQLGVWHSAAVMPPPCCARSRTRTAQQTGGVYHQRFRIYVHFVPGFMGLRPHPPPNNPLDHLQRASRQTVAGNTAAVWDRL